jgi:hypothetical protein
VDGAELAPGELVNLGRVAQAPRSVEVAVTPQEGGTHSHFLTARLDGRRVVPPWPATPARKPRVELDEPLGPTDHELVLTFEEDWPLANRSQVNLHFSLAPLLRNGGFEEAGGWSHGVWSGDETTKYRVEPVTDTPHSGGRCLLMEGLAGHLNMVASQVVPLKLGATYVLTGYYRGDVAAKASLCNTPGTGQYIWSPPIGPAADWTAFTWEFTVENPNPPLILGLRSGSVGLAFFDDLALTEKP